MFGCPEKYNINMTQQNVQSTHYVQPVHQGVIYRLFELHLLVQWALFIVGHQVNQRLKLGVADQEQATFKFDATVFDFTLSSVKIDISKC